MAELETGKNPGKLRLLVEGLIDLPMLIARELPGILRGFRTLSRYNKEHLASGRAMPPGVDDAPYSPFNTALTHRRTFAYRTFSLGDIKVTSKRMGVSINDLFVAVCAGAIRQFLRDSDFDPDAGPLVCTLPVNLRPPAEQDDLVGNQVGTGYMWVPSHLEDPRQRWQVARKRSK